MGCTSYVELTRVVREDGSVASGEVKGSGLGVANEDTGASSALVEVEPLLSLEQLAVDYTFVKRRTLGCQCSSRRPLGSSSTIVAAIVLEMGKLVESMRRKVPPCPGTGSEGWS